MSKARHMSKLTALTLIADISVKTRSGGYNKVTAELFQDKEGQSFKFFCFSGKSVRYARHVGQRQMPQSYRETLGDFPGSMTSVSFLWSLW